MAPVPRDGETIGEVMMRGNVVMHGYLKNKTSTDAAFAGGWFHSGDLGVMHPDGYIQLKDRSKDIIISGGENISSIEVEDALYKHPAVQAAAVVAKPDDKWGETPCAFVELKPGAKATRRRHHRALQGEPRGLQGAAPRRVRRSAEDEHGQDPEIQAARDGEGGVDRHLPIILRHLPGAPMFARRRSQTMARAAARKPKALQNPRLRRRGAARSCMTISSAACRPKRVQELIEHGVLGKKAGLSRHPGADVQAAAGQRDALKTLRSGRDRAAVARDRGGAQGIRRRGFRAQMAQISRSRP